MVRVGEVGPGTLWGSSWEGLICNASGRQFAWVVVSVQGRSKTRRGLMEGAAPYHRGLGRACGVDPLTMEVTGNGPSPGAATPRGLGALRTASPGTAHPTAGTASQGSCGS